MPLEVIRGKVTNPIAAKELEVALEENNIDGALYLGYPLIATAEDSHTIEAMLVSQKHGLVAFDFPTPNLSGGEIVDRLDHIFFLLEGNLKKHESLRKGRSLAFEPQVIGFFADKKGKGKPGTVADPSTLAKIFNRLDGLNPKIFRALCSAIQRVTTIKPRKRRENVSSEKSMGAILKKIEAEIANLDQWQKKAAIELPSGPQRIRGLAGSGKTIVLALKAAYLHAQYPDWTIWVTFHTRSLRQQFEDLIERFSIEHSGDKPNWEKLKILHSWGSLSDPGVYSEISKMLGFSPHNWTSAKERFGYGTAFTGACQELLDTIDSPPIPKVDVVLIDEAQDLPIPFFRLVYKVVRPPKNIVWAYDELQNLSRHQVPDVAKLFGASENGTPLVTIQNVRGQSQQDIVLPVCYRNTPWALTLAHGLGFALHRNDGKGTVQFFDEPSLMREVGYQVVSGKLQLGKSVVVKRRDDSYPSFFPELLDKADAVKGMAFSDSEEQYAWLVKDVKGLLAQQEIDPDDILVILPDAILAQSEYRKVAMLFARYGIETHLAGVSTDRDTFFRRGSVTFSNIYRAKGNEAPVVYILNSEHCASGQEMISLRNTLFTAITRARAWVRILGVGPGMKDLMKEIRRIEEDDFQLSFKVPTAKELEKMRTLHRDRTSEEKEQIDRAMKYLPQIKELIDKGLLNPDTSPELDAIFRAVQELNKDPD